MRQLILSCCFLLLVVSCEDIISLPDISEDQISVIAPVDGAILEEGLNTFTWEELEFADQYQLQIARPNFETPSQVVFDTLVGDSTQVVRNLTLSLTAETYQWRIRGLNSEFMTDYTTANIEVVPDTMTNDLSNESVTVLAPTDQAELMVGTINFNWETLESATDYMIQIATPDFDNATQLLTNSTVTVTTFSQDLEAGAYEWRVNASNDESSTAFITQSITVVDEVVGLSDQTVVLISPEDNLETSETSITFSWEAITEATLYRIRITDTTDGSVFTEQNTPDTNIMIDLQPGIYEWAARAENDTENTLFTSRTITIL